MLEPRQREMRPEWPTLELEPECLVRELDVMMQQLEPRVLLHPQPYDASSAKVRECANASQAQDDGSVLRRDTGHCRGYVLEPLSGLLAEELERKMKALLVDPRRFGRRLTERRRGVQDVAADVGREVNRQKEPHRARSIR